MIQYNRPHLNAEDILEQVCRHRRGRYAIHVRQAKAQVLTRYVEYENLSPSFRGIGGTALSNEAYDGYRRNYRYSSPQVKLIDRAARMAQPTARQHLCPLCGFGEPSTMDHALPCALFPEFSVMPLNLLPACAKCNTDKGVAWFGESGRLFVHPYFDSIPDEQFLFMDFLEVAVDKVGINFRISRPVGVQDDLWNVISSHFSKLELADRYMQKAVGEISTYVRVANQSQVISAQDFTAELHNDLTRTIAAYGRNYWRSAMLTECAASQPFIKMATSR